MNDMKKPSTIEQLKTPLLLSLLAWIMILVTYIFKTPSDNRPLPPIILWSTLMGILGVTDLLATALALAPFFDHSTDPENQKDSKPEKNQFFLLFRASTWGSIKLVSLTLLGTILYKVRDVPISAFLVGLSIYIVLPLVGGIVWYFKNRLNHENSFSSEIDLSRWGSFKIESQEDDEKTSEDKDNPKIN